jgi:hypothetical protein
VQFEHTTSARIARFFNFAEELLTSILLGSDSSDLLKQSSIPANKIPWQCCLGKQCCLGNNFAWHPCCFASAVLAPEIYVS